MPANAAAWYMAKRKFYMNQSFDQQLLPFLLKKYPEKFKVIGSQVIFLEVYNLNQEVAKIKLKYLVQYGLNAYFSHKSEEYGVYFFDPFYYENTEPFHESLRQVSSRPNMNNKAKLVSTYFSSAGLKDQFKFQQHSAYLVSISKQPGVKIITNTTGVIISMINNQYGFIKFGSGETALFSCKSLFKDGWQFSADPLKLPAMKFDGYQIVGGGVRGEQAYSWYAVLVWCGRRPSPKFCSTAEDLNSTPVFREGRLQRMSVGGSPIQGEGKRKLRQPSSSMMVGEVVDILRNGAVLKVREDSQDKVFVPGWKRQLANGSSMWLSTMSGECIGLGDLVAYYVDVQDVRAGYTAVGKNVMVLKESQEVKDKQARRRRRQSTERSAGAKYGVGDTSGEEKDIRRRVANTDDSDSGSDDGVTDGELEWLEKDIGLMIGKEDPQAKTLKLLQNVQTQLGAVRGSKKGPKKSGGSKVARLWSELVAMNAKKTPKLAAASKLVVKAKFVKKTKKAALAPKTPHNKHLRNVFTTGHATSPETLVIRSKKVSAPGAVTKVKLSTPPVKKGIKRKSAISDDDASEDIPPADAILKELLNMQKEQLSEFLPELREQEEKSHQILDSAGLVLKEIINYSEKLSGINQQYCSRLSQVSSFLRMIPKTEH